MNKPLFTFDELYSWTGDHTGSLVFDDILRVVRSTNLIRAQDVAEVLDLPLAFLEYECRYMSGLTLGEIIVQWRVRQCAQLLRETDLSYTEISHLCGWRSPSTMIRVFERCMDGQTPMEYRTGRYSNLRRGPLGQTLLPSDCLAYHPSKDEP